MKLTIIGPSADIIEAVHKSVEEGEPMELLVRFRPDNVMHKRGVEMIETGFGQREYVQVRPDELQLSGLVEGDIILIDSTSMPHKATGN